MYLPFTCSALPAAWCITGGTALLLGFGARGGGWGVGSTAKAKDSFLGVGVQERKEDVQGENWVGLCCSESGPCLLPHSPLSA